MNSSDDSSQLAMRLKRIVSSYQTTWGKAMFTTILTLLGLFTANANASFNVGDKAQFDVEIRSPGIPANTVAYTIEVTQRSGDIYSIRETLAGNVTEYTAKELELSASKAFSPDFVDFVLANCKGPGEKMEVINAPIGTFNACTMPLSQDGSSNISAAKAGPFGVVRKTVGPASDGTFNIYMLRSFAYGR